VTFKGFPQKSPNVQARHSFAGALMDIAMYREPEPEIELAVGLPDGFATYQGLVRRVSWLTRAVPFSIFWVDSSGGVRVQSPANA
jgi:hypothetical protein